ncbi:hypothetical protein GGS23DRAFT_582373 [Durotheca rogersii]|uniref:uncharacterized protein n=1 Tax=Durotheca rogersii TaxID=419775 RepID=UPI00221FCE7B|nr:uncharacterized protein GGS23DRAFT_582373 [Durotheca rogersii]KAI5860072.1 hypothetical protein GGS23DRAFT_582373 [Durotheca rogersii]
MPEGREHTPEEELDGDTPQYLVVVMHRCNTERVSPELQDLAVEDAIDYSAIDHSQTARDDLVGTERPAGPRSIVQPQTSDAQVHADTNVTGQASACDYYAQPAMLWEDAGSPVTVSRLCPPWTGTLSLLSDGRQQPSPGQTGPPMKPPPRPPIAKACDSCRARIDDGLTRLACPFFKHDPLAHLDCAKIGKENIAKMDEHVKRKHKRNVSMTKRPLGNNRKWYLLWSKLFDNAPEPACPYLHPADDLQDVFAERGLDGGSECPAYVGQ